jgi:maltose-binding protein MalE
MKKHSLLIRAVMMLLCLSMLLSAFAACAKDEKNEQTTQDSTDEPVETAPARYLKDALPENLNFNKEFTVFAEERQQNHFYATEESVGAVAQAVYARNMTVEERLGIEMKWVWEPGNKDNTQRANFVKKAEADWQASNSYETIIAYNLTPYEFANKGMLINLNDEDLYIDLSGPWWPSVFTDRLLYKDTIFALVNSCGYGTLTNLTAIYFNNTLIEAKKLPDPYDLVANDEWNAATLKEIIKGTYENKNTTDGDNAEGVDEKDLFGLATSTAPRLTCWYVGFGARLSDLNAEGELILTVNNDRMQTAIETILDLFSTEDALVNESAQYVMFKEERAIFYLSTLSLSTSIVTDDLKINYGVAPIPKMDASQTRYYTHVPNTHEAWCIPSGVPSLEASSAFVECMASEAYRQIDDVFFETALKVRYAPDERLAGMYDLVRDSISFDFLYMYKNVLQNDIDAKIRNCFTNPNKYQWATQWGSIGTSVQTDFDAIVSIYENQGNA